MAEAGQVGTLTNNETGLKIHGKYDYDYTNRTFRFSLDGTSGANVFVKAEWTFEADKPPLPTEPGIYTVKSDLPLEEKIIFRLDEFGVWLDAMSTKRSEAQVGALHQTFGLVRLVEESV